MRKGFFSVLLLAALALTNGCSTDFDLYADYKDITVVYGLLDSSDDTAWIKITKAFTGPGNALLIAKNPDSSNYPFKLNVKLQGVKNGNPLPAIVFDTMTIHNKRPGDSTFYFPEQLVYFAKTSLDINAKYDLVIDKEGTEITSETPLVGDFTISQPNKFISFTSSIPSEIKWSLAENGKRYELFFVFNYQELSPGNPDTLNKKVSWFLGTDTDDNGSRTYVGETFYKLLETELESIPNVKRWAGKVSLSVACGSETLNNYLVINEADNSLLTEVPVFTNIKGGTGVFASRHTAYKDVLLTPKSIEMLVEDYPGLGFRYPVK